MNFKKFIRSTFILPALLAILILPGTSLAGTAKEIDADVDKVLKDFFKKVGAAEKLSEKAEGVLVFPSVLKAGIGLGGEYGEGALRVKGKTVDYYSTAAASIGFQFGAQSKTVILMFMEKESFQKFHSSNGWEVGVDASVALVKVGAGGSLDTTNLAKPVLGFIVGQKGLMYNLTLEGSKMTKLVR